MSTPPPLPPITTLPTLPSQTLTQILDSLFEPSAPLHTLALPTLRTNPSPTYAQLCTSIGSQLQTLLSPSSPPEDTAALDAILSAHPRLGEKKAGSLSEASKGEQAGLREGAEELTRLNAAYEGCFHGLRYTTFVNSRPLPVIMADMRERIARNDPEQERRDAIQAMVDIAIDRAGKMGG